MRGLVALAGIALVVAACGGSPSPTASPSTAPSLSSSPPAASPSAAAGTSYSLRLPADGGKKLRVVVHDPESVLSGIRLPTGTEAADVENTPMSGDAAVAGGRNSKALVVAWVGTVCDRKVDVTVHGATLTVAPAPRGPCDAMALGRAVTLRFKSAVDATKMLVGFVPPPQTN